MKKSARRDLRIQQFFWASWGLAALASACLCLFVISKMRPALDDFCIVVEGGVRGPIDAVIYWYRHFSGRWAATFTSYLMNWISIARGSSAIALSGLFLGLSAACAFAWKALVPGMSRATLLVVGVAQAALVWKFTPHLTENWLWNCGGAVYGWPVVLAIAGFAAIHRGYLASGSLALAWACGSNEPMAAVLLAATVALSVKDRKWRGPFMACSVSTVILVVAPGNWVRHALVVKESKGLLEIPGLWLSMAFGQMRVSLGALWYWILIQAIFSLGIVSKKPLKTPRHFLLVAAAAWAAVFLVETFLMAVSVHGLIPRRAWILEGVATLGLASALGIWLAQRKRSSLLAFGVALGGAVGLLVAGYQLSLLARKWRDLTVYADAYDRRMQLVRNAPEGPIRLERLPSSWDGVPAELAPDPENWANRCFQQALGLRGPVSAP